MRMKLLVGMAALAMAASGSAAMASGSSGGGAVGGGSVTTPGPCGNLTVAITASVSPAGYWQASGKTETSCDSTPGLRIKFVDATPADSCTVVIPDFVNASYFKYGVRPISRYASGYIWSSPECVGSPRTINATLYSTAGAVLSTASTTWTP